MIAEQKARATEPQHKKMKASPLQQVIHEFGNNVAIMERADNSLYVGNTVRTTHSVGNIYLSRSAWL